MKKKFSKAKLLGSTVIAMLFLISTGCSAKSLPQNSAVCPEISNKDEVFYTGYFQVSGIGFGENESTAKAAARLQARARLVKLINGTTIIGHNNGTDQINERYQGMVRYAYIYKEKYFPDKRKALTCLRLAIKKGSVGDLVPQLIDDVR